MMAAPGLPTDIKTHEKEFLICTLCKELFNNSDRHPRLMPCLHTVCMKCLVNTKEKIKCPNCVEVYKITKKVTDLFPRDNTKRNIIDLTNLQTKPSAVRCGCCDKTLPVKYRCEECSSFLCQECYGVHRHWGRFKTHKVLHLDSIDNWLEVNIKHEEKCPEPGHEAETLNFFCSKRGCEKSICALCAFSLHKESKGHTVNKIEDQYKKVQEEFQSKCKHLEQKVLLVESVKERVCHEKEHFQKCIPQTKDDINREFETVLQALQKRKEVLKREVDVIEKRKKKKIEKKEKSLENLEKSISYAIQYTQHSLKTSNHSSMMEVASTVNQRLEHLANASCDFDPVSTFWFTYKLEEGKKKYLRNVDDIGTLSDAIPSASNTEVNLPQKANQFEDIPVNFQLKDESRNLIHNRHIDIKMKLTKIDKRKGEKEVTESCSCKPMADSAYLTTLNLETPGKYRLDIYMFGYCFIRGIREIEIEEIPRRDYAPRPAEDITKQDQFESGSETTKNPKRNADTRTGGDVPKHAQVACEAKITNESKKVGFYGVYEPTRHLCFASIDIGSRCSGYGYAFLHDLLRKDTPRIYNGRFAAGCSGFFSLKCPTSVLLNPDKSFNSFGFDAEGRYAELTIDEYKGQYMYFENIRVRLLVDSVSQDVLDAHGRAFPAFDLLSMIIHYFKQRIMYELERMSLGVCERDIFWIISCPMQKNHQVLGFIRRASEKAGISSEDMRPICENEASLFYCYHQPLESFTGSTISYSPLSKPGKFLIADDGGEALKIMVYEVEDRNMYECVTASFESNDCNFVNLLLSNIVGEDFLENFRTENATDYLELEREVEGKKRHINKTSSKFLTLKLPISLIKMFDEAKTKSFKSIFENEENFTFCADKLKVRSNHFFTLFDTITSTLKRRIHEVLQQPVARDVDVIIMVGGISEYYPVQTGIQTAFPEMKVIIPSEPALSVVKGAVLSCLHLTDYVTKRVSRFTYGIGIYVPFNSQIHPVSRKSIIDGVGYCKDVLLIMIKRGESPEIGQTVLKKIFSPVRKDQKIIGFEVFQTESCDAKYTDEEGCSLLGRVLIDISDISGGINKNVRVSVVNCGTELQLEATVLETGKKRDMFFSNCGKYLNLKQV